MKQFTALTHSWWKKYNILTACKELEKVLNVLSLTGITNIYSIINARISVQFSSLCPDGQKKKINSKIKDSRK